MTGTIFILTFHILLASISRSLYLLSFIIIIITTTTTTTTNSEHFSWFSKGKGHSPSTFSITLLKTYYLQN